MTNKVFTVLITAIFVGVFFLGGVATTWACQSAGPNKHVGAITAIDAKAKTFTIQDAETNHPMTFEATDKVLRELKLQDRVLVGYKEEDGRMIAVDVHS